MEIFSTGSKGVTAWGPTASVDIDIPALDINGADENWLLTNLSIGAHEIVDVRQCFQDVSYIYALGNNQGQCSMTLTFAIFIGSQNCAKDGDNTEALHYGLDAYCSNRISTESGMKATTITIGSFSREGWLTGLDIGNLDAAKGICYGTANFIVKLQ